MASEPIRMTEPVKFGEDFELDLRAYELRREGRALRLERIPMDLLVLLVERRGELVTRDQIIEKIWGKDVFLDTDGSINSAIRKIRQVLRDDPEQPRFVLTVSGRGYRFIAPVEEVIPPPSPAADAQPLPPESILGKKVSHYRVLQLLGGGGMGVVYKAEDLKLGRLVALKFLPSELASDPIAFERLQQEARAASVLDHPNICSIYQLGEHEGQPFIVMQLLEGQTLRDWIETAPPDTASRVNTLLELAMQITDGMQAAHEKGIIHRDIKPANIFITSRGQARILDFGVAKFMDAAEPPDGKESEEAAGERPVTPMPDPNLTRTGASVGTPSYLSPEQIRREKLDARTDLFSFGLVLYEMATGLRAFSGDTVTAIRHAVLHLPVEPIRSLNSQLPPGLEDIVNKALAKDREQRYQSAAEIRTDLKALRGATTSEGAAAGDMVIGTHQGTGSAATPAPLTSSRAMSRWVIFGALCGVLAAALVVAWWAARRPAAPPHFTQRRITANPVDLPVDFAAISPDGKYLGYSDQQGVHLRLVATAETQNVPPPSGINLSDAVWSFDSWYPDSTRFTAALSISGKPSSLWAVPLLGGTPQELIEGFDSSAGVSPNGSAIAFLRSPGPLGSREIWLSGGHGESPHLLLAAEEQSGFRDVIWSPAGDRVAYIHRRKKGDKTESFVESCARTGDKRTTIISASKMGSVAWIAPGRLIYSRYIDGANDYYSTDLWELTVEPRTGAPQGNPRRLTDWSGFQVSNLTATADGKHLSFVRGAGHESVLVGELGDNKDILKDVHPLTQEDFSNIPLAWTPDSRQVVFSSERSGGRQIYKQALDGSAPQVVTQDPSTEFFLARLAPDGASWFVEGCASASNKCGLYQVGASGGSPQLLFETGGSFVPYNCSYRQANLCVFGQRSLDRKNLIIASFGLAGKGKELAKIPVDPAGGDYSWALSPDGLKIAITKTDSMISEITIIPLHGDGTRKIDLRGYSNLESIDWMSNSKSMFVGTSPPSGAALLHVTLDGSVRQVWKQSQIGYVWGIPSPDGRHIALSGRSWDANVWMIDNF